MKKLFAFVLIFALVFTGCNPSDGEESPVESIESSDPVETAADPMAFKEDFISMVYGWFSKNQFPEYVYHADIYKSEIGTKEDIKAFEKFQKSLTPSIIEKLLLSATDAYAPSVGVSFEDEEFVRSFLEKLKSLEIELYTEKEPQKEPAFYEIKPETEEADVWEAIIKTETETWGFAFWGDAFYARIPEKDYTLKFDLFNDLEIGEDITKRAEESFDTVFIPEAKPTDVLKVFKAENGKYGLKNSVGEIVVEAKYVKIDDEYDHFALINVDGEYEGLYYDGEKVKYSITAQPKPAYDICFPNGDIVPGGPYESYEVRDFGEGFSIFAAKNGNYYSWEYYGNGFTNPYFAEKWEGTRTSHPNYRETLYYYWSNYGCHGLIDDEGKTVIPAVNLSIDIPFNDRALGLEGASYQGIGMGRMFIYGLPSGKIINDDYNYISYYSFDEGYFGVGISCGEYAENAYPVQEDGSIAPEGWWFVDKDGNKIGKCYERISLDENFSSDDGSFWGYTEITDINTKVYARLSDGTAEVFTVKELLIKK